MNPRILAAATLLCGISPSPAEVPFEAPWLLEPQPPPCRFGLYPLQASGYSPYNAPLPVSSTAGTASNPNDSPIRQMPSSCTEPEPHTAGHDNAYPTQHSRHCQHPCLHAR